MGLNISIGFALAMAIGLVGLGETFKLHEVQAQNNLENRLSEMAQRTAALNQQTADIDFRLKSVEEATTSNRSYIDHLSGEITATDTAVTWIGGLIGAAIAFAGVMVAMRKGG